MWPQSLAICPFSLDLRSYLKARPGSWVWEGSTHHPFFRFLISHWGRYLTFCWKCLFLTTEIENSSARCPCLPAAWAWPCDLSLSVVPEKNFWESSQARRTLLGKIILLVKRDGREATALFFCLWMWLWCYGLEPQRKMLDIESTS